MRAKTLKTEVSDFIKRRESRALRLATAVLSVVKRGNGDRWYCLHISGGCEMAVEKHLLDCGVEAFVPREEFSEVRRGKKVEGERVMLPGYVLVKFMPSPTAFAALLSQKNVRGFVGGSMSYYVVRDADVEKLRAPVTDQMLRVEVDKTICEGSTVMIIDGPFVGLQGTVLAVKFSRQARARLLVTLDGRSMEIESHPLAFVRKL